MLNIFEKLVLCNTRIKADILNRRIVAFKGEVDRITVYIHLKHGEMVFCPLFYVLPLWNKII